MTSKQITGYLNRKNRLSIPRIGTLVRLPDDGRVAFTRLQTDDGDILAGLVAEEEHLSSEQARQEVNRFVKEVEDTTAAGHRYPVSGLGWFYADPQGTVRFEYDPSAAAATNSDAGPVRKESAVPAARPPERMPAEHARGSAAVQAVRKDYPTREERPQISIRRPRKRGMDRTIIAAIIALIIALGVLLYGYFAKPSPELRLDTGQTEMPQAPETT